LRAVGEFCAALQEYSSTGLAGEGRLVPAWLDIALGTIKTQPARHLQNILPTLSSTVPQADDEYDMGYTMWTGLQTLL